MVDPASAEELQRWKDRLLRLEREICSRLSEKRTDTERDSGVVRDDDGDTIFQIDIDAEDVVLEHAEAWASESSFVLVAEGIEPSTGRHFGSGSPTHRVILDPIDGTRGLMFDKRSAWSLGAVAPERGPETSLRDIAVAVMHELPTSRQAIVDVLHATRGRGARRISRDLWRETEGPAPLRPSPATDLRHGFATVCNFFQGGKELTAKLDEELMARALGGWTVGKAEVYTDQYISSGGQLAELALGRDRFVLDARPLVHRALGHPDTLCSRPYDLCTALIAIEAGCIVQAPEGGPLDAPLDTTTNVGFVGFANRSLAESIRPMLDEALRVCGLTTGD